MVISGKLDHTHEVYERKLDRKLVRLSVIQITTYLKIRTLYQPAVVRRSEMDKLTFLEQYAKYQNGERNRHQYIKAIVFKYSARTDV
jgi:hypothetical protein